MTENGLIIDDFNSNDSKCKSMIDELDSNDTSDSDSDNSNARIYPENDSDSSDNDSESDSDAQIHPENESDQDLIKHTNQPGVTQTPEDNGELHIIDKFLQIYNTKHNTTGSMFENVDVKNPTSTNDKMEMFYEYMQEHQSLNAENPVYVDVYEPNTKIENSESYDVFTLVTGKESKIKYLSLSFISLLTIGCQSPEDVGPYWSIIKM